MYRLWRGTRTNKYIKIWNLEASNDDISWNILHSMNDTIFSNGIYTINDNSITNPSEFRQFTFYNETSYKYYRLYIVCSRSGRDFWFIYSRRSEC